MNEEDLHREHAFRAQQEREKVEKVHRDLTNSVLRASRSLRDATRNMDMSDDPAAANAWGNLDRALQALTEHAEACVRAAMSPTRPL